MLWHFIGSKIRVEQARAGHIIISGIRLIALLILCELLTEQEWLIAGLCPCWCQRGKSSSHLFKSLAEWRGSWTNGWENKKRLIRAYGGRFFIDWALGVKQDTQKCGWKGRKQIPFYTKGKCPLDAHVLLWGSAVMPHPPPCTRVTVIPIVLGSPSHAVWDGSGCQAQATRGACPICEIGRAFQMLLASMWWCLVPSPRQLCLPLENQPSGTCRVVKPPQSNTWAEERFYPILSITQRIRRQLCCPWCSAKDWHRFISANTASFCYRAK